MERNTVSQRASHGYMSLVLPDQLGVSSLLIFILPEVLGGGDQELGRRHQRVSWLWRTVS